jgi:sensor histidine kinase YesM
MSFLQKMGVTVRSWKEFGNTSKVQLPNVSNPSLLLQRLQSNLMHWSGNYLVVSAIIFGYGLFAAPLMIVAIGFAFLAYSYFMVINSTPMRVAGTELNTKQKIGGVVAITAFLFFITSGFTILWVAGISSFLVLLHAAFRQPSVSNKVSSFLDHFSPDGPDSATPFQEVSEAIQDMQEDADQQQNSMRREEWDTQREQYHQFASQMRTKYDLAPQEPKDTV